MKPIRSKSFSDLVSKISKTNWYIQYLAKYEQKKREIEELKAKGECIDRDYYEELSILKDSITLSMAHADVLRGHNWHRPYIYNPGGHAFITHFEGRFKGEPFHFYTFQVLR